MRFYQKTIFRILRRSLMLAVVCASCVMSQQAKNAEADPNTLTGKEKKEGWRLLFDGKTMDGWRGAYMDSLPKKGWEVRDGMLIVKESGGGEASFGGDIVTLEPYASFELKLDFKLTDIALAIHNHGPTDQRFPSPESAYSLIKNMDKRMGLCIDVGHTQRLGLDPASEVERFFDRLLDVHIKDVSSADAKGSTVEIGRGVIDIPKLLRTLAKLKYTGTLHFEHEKDQKDSLPGVAESVGYVRGVLATI